MQSAATTSLRVADHDDIITLDYSGALAAHAGDSWFGVAVGFRMLQAAANGLSQHRIWQRDELFVVSGHPGNGVRDVIEYVTCCVSRDRYRLDTQSVPSGCTSSMRFEWEVGDGIMVASIRLRDGFVPQALYDLLDRRGTPAERDEDAARFGELKRSLAEQVWDEPLASLFAVDLLEPGVAGHA